MIFILKFILFAGLLSLFGSILWIFYLSKSMDESDNEEVDEYDEYD